MTRRCPWCAGVYQVEGVRWAQLVLLALLLACPVSAQLIGQAFGPSFGAHMFTYGSASAGSGAFLNTRCYRAGTVQAWAVFSLGAAVPPVPFPLSTAAGDLLVDVAPAQLVGVEAMALCCGGVIESAFVLTIPAAPALAGVSVFSQCLVLDVTGAWSLTHGWEVQLLP